MAEDRRYADSELARAPHPFDHIVASPVYSPDWGRGWLGYIEEQTDLWFVHGDRSASELLGYTKLMTYNDKINSRLWMILVDAESGESYHGVLVFLLNPPEDAVLFPIPTNLKRVMEEYGRVPDEE